MNHFVDVLINPVDVVREGDEVFHITRGSGGLTYDVLSTFLPDWAEEHTRARVVAFNEARTMCSYRIGP